MNRFLVVALVCGAAGGAGLWLVLGRLLPARVDLDAALRNLDPRPAPVPGPVPPLERVGALADRWLPGIVPPQADLSITGTTVDRWLGEKVLLGLLGVCTPGLLAALLAVAGLRLPAVVPAVAGIALGVVFFLAPDAGLRARAALARRDFSRAVAAYVELVALERRAASGTVQAMESAATVADTWAFRRIRGTLLRARLDGAAPWTALTDLAHEIRVPELADFAGTMRLAGEESAQVYQTLRSQARGLRSAMLNAEHARANAASDSMSVPAAAGGMVFLALLMAPALMRMM